MGFKRGEIDHGEMAEWSIAAVLKTVELRGSGGSNPSLSAIKGVNQRVMRFTPFSTPNKLLLIKMKCISRGKDMKLLT